MSKITIKILTVSYLEQLLLISQDVLELNL